VLKRLEEETIRIRRSASRGATSEFELIAAEQREIAQRADLATLELREPLLSARVERLRSELRGAERALELRIEDRRRLESAEAGVARAEAAAAQSRAALDAARLELDRMSVRAPVSGFVQQRLKVPGDKVGRAVDDRESIHILHLYDPSKIQVRVDVPLADASFVGVGQPCEVIVEVLPDRVFRGVVTRATHEADLQKNTLQFKVGVLDPDPVLRPEMLTRVKFLGSDETSPGASGTGSDADRVRVPESALETTGDRTRVWLVADRRSGRGALASRVVRVLSVDDGWATIAGDLRPGALIAVDPVDPEEGQAVTFAESPRAVDVKGGGS
jgi:HlyD family secretion protein